MSRKSVLYTGLAVLIVASMLLGGCTSTAQNACFKEGGNADFYPRA